MYDRTSHNISWPNLKQTQTFHSFTAERPVNFVNLNLPPEYTAANDEILLYKNNK